ncbi:MAG: GNAT family N-acetyltransferase [Acidimicrobiales bacterium]
MGATIEIRVRRVGFRSGTDAELTALHAVESPVEAERRADRVPQPLSSYMAFARSIPSRFDDHAWLAETPGGTPIASGFCWSNAAGDPRNMECDLLVRREHRREGIGSLLLSVICEETVKQGRSLLTWSTFDAVAAGGAFSRRVGARSARVNRTSQLTLADVDWPMVRRWADAKEPRARGYRIEMVDGAFPPHLRADAARFHHIMQTAPRDDLDIADVTLDSNDIAELDWARLEGGRPRWTVLVRDPGGVCVGGTEVTFEAWDPTAGLQENTGIESSHRGLKLAKWAKATLLERVRQERPHIQRIRTDNAFSNAPMLAINKSLGFEVISTRTEWQADVSDIAAALHR